MWRRWLAVLAVAALAIALVAVAEIFSLATEGQPQGHTHAHNQYQPVYASIVQLLIGGWNWLRDRVDRDTLTSVFIGVTAIFTGTLWWSTRQLWQSSQGHAEHMAASAAEAVRAANAMEDVARHIAASVASVRELSAQQMRAYLSVVIGPAIYQESGRDVRFEAKPIVVNTGQTPAHQVRYAVRAEIMPLPFPPPGFNFALPGQPIRGGAVIGPRQERQLSAIIDSFVLDADVEIIKRGGGLALAVWGTINYVDVFDEPHFTNFCQILAWLPNNAAYGYYTADHNDSD